MARSGWRGAGGEERVANSQNRKGKGERRPNGREGVLKIYRRPKAVRRQHPRRPEPVSLGSGPPERPRYRRVAPRQMRSQPRSRRSVVPSKDSASRVTGRINQRSSSPGHGGMIGARSGVMGRRPAQLTVDVAFSMEGRSRTAAVRSIAMAPGVIVASNPTCSSVAPTSTAPRGTM